MDAMDAMEATDAMDAMDAVNVVEAMDASNADTAFQPALRHRHPPRQPSLGDASAESASSTRAHLGWDDMDAGRTDETETATAADDVDVAHMADSTSYAEPDTCRICRGEGTPTEPLFFPCKCSGSIKYVHKDCLMEWLSHSQKKHCELCKTSFRFTKLYKPMPEQLPLLVFVQHLTKYLFRNMLVWLRVGLVVSVWLGWLPYLTRWEWSFFFWMSEEGLVSQSPLFIGGVGSMLVGNTSTAVATAATAAASTPLAAAGASVSEMAASLSAVCPSSPLFSSSATAATAAVAAASAAAVSYGANTTAKLLAEAPEAGMSTLSTVIVYALDWLLGSSGSSGGNMSGNQAYASASAAGSAASSAAGTGTGTGTGVAGAGVDATLGTRPSSLLSDVGFLRNLTRYGSVNWAIIYALEGQIITILVIVCCVLVILVRDYVVQQQPEINMRAGFAAAAGEDADVLDGPVMPQRGDPGVRDDEAPEWEGRRIPGAHPEVHPEGHYSDDEQGMPTTVNRIILPPEIEAAQRRNNLAASDEAGGPSQQADTRNGSLDSPHGINGNNGNNGVENGIPAEEGATVHEYLQVYREAGGDPDEILRIARARNLEDRLAYWIRLTQNVAKNRQTEQDGPASESGAHGAPREDVSQNAQASVWSSSWPWGDDDEEPSDKATRVHRKKQKAKEMREPADAEEEGQDGGIDKGKGRERAHDEDDSNDANDENEAHGSSNGWAARRLRPRSNTDGPPLPDGLNPLAYNTWSFPKSSPQQDKLAAGPSSATKASFTSDENSAEWEYTSEEEDEGAEVIRVQMAFDEEEDDDDDEEEEEEEEVLLVLDRDIDMDDVREAETEVEQEPEQEEQAEQDAEQGAEQEADGQDDDGVPDLVPRRFAPPAAPAADNWINRAADFMWRDLADINPMELNAPAEVEVEDGPFDAPDPRNMIIFEPLDDADMLEEEEAAAAAAAAAVAGMDAEAMEDAEDLEGLMEILGMRGPVAALFQNAIFCAFLVTLTLVVGVFLPYNVGRMTVWLVANPMRPVLVLFGLAKLLQDLAVVLMGVAGYAVFSALHALLVTWTWAVGTGGLAEPLAPVLGPVQSLMGSLALARNATAEAALRVAGGFAQEPPLLFSAGEMRNFSALSHEALVSLKGQAAAAVTAVGRAVFGGGVAPGMAEGAAAGGSMLYSLAELKELLQGALEGGWKMLEAAPGLLARPDRWVISLPEGMLMAGMGGNHSGLGGGGIGGGLASVNPAFAYWDGTDRSLAIAVGYGAMFLVAGLYLYHGSPLSSSATGQAWEASLMDALSQASGVLKVMLIIGIEMLVFPLYCGLLLDWALLPLFEDATVMSRVRFSLQYPLTSVFVHWFVGTGYMFHFALFVSMCRKIMRRGVLYFIRDPDDPEFHPVRDVLERTVTTQLRKILFSAFVYGALVVVCLGGVVWGLAFAAPGVLPIHYSSNEPVLEFPIDLMFYNFLMPLAIRFFRPSDGLHVLYTWWFRKSARILRLTWFLFGERRLDEEGTLVYKYPPPDTPDPSALQSFAQSFFLEYSYKNNEIVAMTWDGVFAGGRARPRGDLADKEMRDLTARKRHLVQTGQLLPNGRFVRAPASDQVKINKGRTVFLEVDNDNHRKDSTAAGAVDIYSSIHYRFVYLPPRFRLRVLLFIVFIWLFAATTGVGCTILPLLFGRRVFQYLLPAHVRTNDIYAFSIGIYVLGSAAYGLWHARRLLTSAVDAVRRSVATLTASSAAHRAAAVVVRAARIVYAYTFILGVFPLLATALVELYLLIPLHTYMGSSSSNSGSEAPPARHTVRLVQSWTLGLLYLKLGARFVTVWYDGSRLATAVRAVLRRGQLDPDINILTRAFVVPGLLLGGAAMGLPLLLAQAAMAKQLLGFVAEAGSASATGSASNAGDAAARVHLAYRLSYPAVALVALAAWSVWGMMDVFASWRVRIRDEAYLIGERLHNFGPVPTGHGQTRGRRPAGEGVVL